MTPNDAYSELLDATIFELEQRQREGQRYVALTAGALEALSGPALKAGREASANRPNVAKARLERAEPAVSVISAPATPAANSAVIEGPAPLSRPEPDLVISTAHGKGAAMTELRDRALVCQKCPNLVATRKNVVFGVGSINAELMFVGEAPGADEDDQGEPFVGKAGQLLTKIIQTMGLTREQVYIANILKCRPDTPGQSFGNRAPKPEEMERCLPYLRAQIDLIKPKAMVALGATAVEGLFGKVPGIGITKLRGRWKEFRGIPVMPTYHPSYLLRPNPNNIKREAWEDMLQVMDRLNMPISEKQRGYFLKSAA